MKRTRLFGDVEGSTGGEPSTTIATRRLSDQLDVTNVAVVSYRVPPGEGTPSGLHAHADQEELFVVLAGTATFETLDGSVRVGEGELVRFAPGEFHTCLNTGDELLSLLAIGAPKETTDIRIPVACDSCAGKHLRLETSGETLTFCCPDCSSEYRPVPCPNCSSMDLTVRRPADAVLTLCADCGGRFDRPPMEPIDDGSSTESTD